MRTLPRAACAGFALGLIVHSIGCHTGPARNAVTRATIDPATTSLAQVEPQGQSARDEDSTAIAAEKYSSRAVAAQPGDLTLVQPVAFDLPESEEVPAPEPATSDSQPLELEVEPLVAEIVARNPDIRSAAAAWRAAAQRYPQEVSLDDPMYGFILGPGSWGSDDVTSAYALEVSQKVPWPGKRQLRGNIAQAEANAAYFDVGEERLRIAEAARIAYYEYFLAHRQLAVIADSAELLQDFRDTAQSKYQSSQVEQQDVLLAEVELAELRRRQLEVARQARVARARINTLLLVPPEAPLAPAPVELPTREVVSSSDKLRSLALSQRPELAAQEARIRAERYAVALAGKEFYPDMEFIARYDAFWQEPEDSLRPMVGMNLNLPIYRQKRWAAVRETRARVAQQQAALEGRINEIAFEVEQAYQRVEESRQALQVYRERLLPTSRQSIEAARAGYTAGRLDFLRLIESQRQLLDLQEGYYEATAQYHQRLAELDRAVGASPLR